MSEASYRQQLAGLRNGKAALEVEHMHLLAEAARFQQEAARLRTTVAGGTGTHAAGNQQRALECERRQRKALTCAAEIEKRIVTTGARVDAVQVELDRLLVHAQKERELRSRSCLEQERREELSHERAVTREIALRRRLFSPALTEAEFNALPSKVSILVVGASPETTEPSYSDEEVREIETKIRDSEYRHALDLQTMWAVRPGDLLQALNEREPSVLHFSGHGTERGEMVFTGNNGEEKPVSPAALAAAVATTEKPPRLIVFNACFSSAQAETVVRHVDSAIGMTKEIDSEASWIFAGRFYNAIGFGYSIKKAFEQAVAALMLEGLPVQDVPRLFERLGIDADKIVLVAPSSVYPQVAG